VLPGTTGEQSLLLVAHADTVFTEGTDRSVSLRADRVIGPGVGDNSLGLAVLATLPTILQELQIEPACDIILMGATRSLGRGNLEGLRFFLDNNRRPLKAGVSVEGGQLGRLSFAVTGMLRGEITASIPEEYDWTQSGATSAIHILANVINGITQIPLPQQPPTRIILGSIRGGNSYNTIPTKAVLRFEARSQSSEMVDELRQCIEDVAVDVSSRTRVNVQLDILARREPGGLEFGHPIVRTAGSIISELGLEPSVNPSISELSAFVAHAIPAVTIGISSVENRHEQNESVAIHPIATGVAQLIGILLAIDGGFGDVD
jgi:acetylornithine deacetylase/succinyl-diaminopimelate desuccinylase-like protein